MFRMMTLVFTCMSLIFLYLRHKIKMAWIYTKTPIAISLSDFKPITMIRKMS
jgi:hypothetical protein